MSPFAKGLAVFAFAALATTGLHAQQTSGVPEPQEGYDLIKQGIGILEQNADLGDPQTAFRVGALYYHGIFVLPDREKALAYFKAAAEGGDPEALYYMGLHYQHGTDVEQDEDLAREMFRAAAATGHEGAQSILLFLQDGASDER